jgi:hypothetical protein
MKEDEGGRKRRKGEVREEEGEGEGDSRMCRLDSCLSATITKHKHFNEIHVYLWQTTWPNREY